MFAPASIPQPAATRKWFCVGLGLLALLRQGRVLANPSGLSIGSGAASVQQLGSQLNVTASQGAVLNWQQFNIGAGETTTFLQPSANSVVLNLIGGANPSQILGNLNANGTVILENASGFYFGPNSLVKVGGSFMATTASLPPDFGTGAFWQFTGPPPLASIVNYGQLQVGQGKSLFLLAANIENHGALSAPGGSVDLVAGQTVLVSESADGRGLSAVVTLPQGSVNNLGQITAAAGDILLQAKVVNQSGTLQADSIQNQNGVIELVASDQLNLGATSQILARGDSSLAGSPGGTVTLESGNLFSDGKGSRVVTTGGDAGGNGGNIELSAPNLQSLNSMLNAGAPSGQAAGAFSLEVGTIALGNTGNSPVSYDANGDVVLNVNKAFQNQNVSQILLQASGNMYVGNGSFNSSGAFTFASNPGITWNLSASTGLPGGQLTLEAGANLFFGNRSLILDANHWAVTLDAGYNSTLQSLQAGSGSIYLGDVVRNSSGIPTKDGAGNFVPANGSGSIQLATGNLTLAAGGSVEVGAGSLTTTAGGTQGGNIDVTALAGDIVVGLKTSGVQNSGYAVNSAGDWDVSANGGGISSLAGGNVTLAAPSGSINPSSRVTTFGVSGAFGANEPGDVTLVAGNQIFGTFNVANGTGTLLAGVSLDSASQPTLLNPNANVGSLAQPVSLQLASGSWNVWAANNLFLSEIRNPALAFDAGDTFPDHYAGTAAANLWAGNGLNLLGQNLPRTDGDATMPAIYPPQVRLTAGAGGLTVESAIVLAPSSTGTLHITTHDGGDVLAVNTDISNPSGITMSDSGSPDWTTFASGHASSPLHGNDPNPVTLDIAGSIYGLILDVPTFATIAVAGSTYNFGFRGQNLAATAPPNTTSITVAGDVVYSDTLHAASVPLADPLPAGLLDPALSGNPIVAAELAYASGRLSINQQMTADGLSFLLNPTVAKLDANGNPVLDPSGNPVTVAVPLDPAQRSAVLALYAESQSENGLALSGPGHFNLSARSVSLGISDGITVDFPDAPDAALTAISPKGASLGITTTGDLNLTATKIANGGLDGAIALSVGGTLDVGGTATALGDPSSPKGIFTTSGGNIDIHAVGNVNVDGSRIAAYNGGNISVTSQTGDINAGSGGEGFVIFQALQLDPSTGQLEAIPTDIPLSGILATTVYGSTAELGNITLSAPNGNINSALGGVLQIAFNSADATANYIQVTAGKDINATGSGIIGYNVKLQAGGDIKGVVVGSQSVAVTSQQSVDVTAVSGGNVNVTAAGTVSGTVIGGGEVSVSGSSIDAAVRGGAVATSGDTSGAALGTPAPAPVQSMQVADSASTATTKSGAETEDDQKKKKNIALAQKVSRVTVLLPPKK